jgi:peptide/nickel transport system permease protein
MLFDQATATVKLAIGATIIAVVAGLGVPTLAFLSPHRFWRARTREIASAWSAIPLPVAGLLWVTGLSILIPIFPATGDGGLQHQVLPWLTLGLGLGGSIGVTVLQMYQQFHSETYYVAMRAKGLTRVQIILRHGIRFVLAHTVDLVYLQFGYALGGVVIIETMFARPGLGRVINTAILNKDLPIIQAVVLLSVLLYSLSMFAADVTSSLLDPRLSAF